MKCIDNGDFAIEANDVSAIQLASESKVPFVVGPAVNTYNARRWTCFAETGMTRWCMPVEAFLGQMAEQRHDTMRGLIFVISSKSKCCAAWLLTAYSARCFLRFRAENKAKDDFETCCIKYPTGLQVDSQKVSQSL